MDEYQNLIFSICLKMTGDYFAAEDLSQETFLSAFQHWDSFDGNNEKSWLARIASNKCIDYLRGAARRQVPTEDIPEQVDQEDQPQELYQTKEVIEKLKQEIDNLNPPYNEVLIQHLIHNKTAKQIAEETNQNVKTIQTHIYRGKALLKQTYGKEMLLE